MLCSPHPGHRAGVESRCCEPRAGGIWKCSLATVKAWTFQRVIDDDVNLHRLPRKKESIVLFLLTPVRLMENLCFYEINSVRMGVYPRPSRYLVWMHKPSLRCLPERAAPVLSPTREQASKPSEMVTSMLHTSFPCSPFPSSWRIQDWVPCCSFPLKLYLSRDPGL